MEDLMSIAATVSSLLLFFLVLRGVYWVWWKPMLIERQLKAQGIFGSPYKLFFGDLKEIGRSIVLARSMAMEPNHRFINRVLPFVSQQVQQFGNICFFWVFSTPRIIIQDAELIKEALANKSGQFQKLPLSPFQRISAGLSSLEGDKWFQHRTILTPAFHLTKLKGMVPAFCTSCSVMIKRWKKLVDNNGVCELDVQSELDAMTADAISRTAFGSNYIEGKKIFELQKQQVALMLKPTKFPYVPGFRFLPTKDNRKRYYLSKQIDEMLRVLINKKKTMKHNECEHEDLLSLMLRSNEQPHENANDRKLKGLTLQEVMEECKLFYFAGHETTCDLLTWTMVLLSMHVNWQNRAREEVIEICGRTFPNYGNISQLKIVNMILLEVLRLYPPLTAQYRHTYNKTRLGRILLPAGVDIMLPTLAIHHDPKFWGKDAEEFNPERFSKGVTKATNNQSSYFPFGWGPKNCIGQNFAMIEARTSLAMLLQHFSFELSPSYVHSPVSNITIQPQYGAPIILHQL